MKKLMTDKITELTEFMNTYIGKEIVDASYAVGINSGISIQLHFHDGLYRFLEENADEKEYATRNFQFHVFRYKSMRILMETPGY